MAFTESREISIPLHNLFARVILPFNLDRPYSYHVPADLSQTLKPGMRVEVQFGRSKIYAGLVSEMYNELEIPTRYKTILSVLDDAPIVTGHQLSTWYWMAEYYCCSIGEVMAAALPAGFKLDSESKITLHHDFDYNAAELNDDEFLVAEALSMRKELTVDEVQQIINKKSTKKLINQLVEKGVIIVEEELKSGLQEKKEDFILLDSLYKSNPDLLTQALDHVAKSDIQTNILLAFIQYAKPNYEISKKQLAKHVDISPAALKALEKKNIIKIERRKVNQDISTKLDIELPPLSAEQEDAINNINAAFEKGQLISLLHGITGSGKTRVYSEFIKKASSEGGQILYLLPEIALTSHLLGRLKKNLGSNLKVYHSRISQRERIETWKSVMDGAPLTVAARSGVFLPFKNLKLIIVDEEHDSSYKQNEPNPKYQARDTAIWLGKLHGAKIILGSATPSMETWYNVKIKKYGFAQLKNRFSDLPLPEFELVDLYMESKTRTEPFIISKILHEGILRALRQKEQIILFQNRRGYAPQQHCSNCKWHAECPNCDISLTYHKHINKLTCHYCGYQRPIFEECPDCGNKSIHLKGYGTEKIEIELNNLYPNARISRLDYDTARSLAQYQNILDRFEEKEIDILVGTQMISKGLDFDHVAIVGILQADSIFYYPEFRSNERAYQLITQVAGRAGRKNKQGKVYLQAYNLNHDVIRYIIHYDYEGLAEKELNDRNEAQYPPMVKLIEITVKHKKPEMADLACLKLSSLLQEKFGTRISNPMLPGISRLRNLYLRSIIIKSERNTTILSEIKQSIKDLIPEVMKFTGLSSTRFSVDVDPE